MPLKESSDPTVSAFVLLEGLGPPEVPQPKSESVVVLAAATPQWIHRHYLHRQVCSGKVDAFIKLLQLLGGSEHSVGWASAKRKISTFGR